jgi:hypothetical protein
MKHTRPPPHSPLIGHNGGPPLDDPQDEEHEPEWGKGGFKTYFDWKRASAKAWKKVPHQIMMLRLDKAERLGLTYEEYSMEILERGIYLQEEDVERIAEIKRGRKKRRRKKKS